MLGAFVHGIGLRTTTTWFVIIQYGLHGLLLKFTNFPGIPMDVVQGTLLRNWKRSQDVER